MTEPKATKRQTDDRNPRTSCAAAVAPEQIERLMAGSLNPLAAWRLRRHLTHCPDCAREQQEIAQLYADLRTLRGIAPARPAPAWSAIEDAKGARRATPPDFLTIGGFAMKKRTVIVACAALFCLSATGFAARQWFYNPFHEMPAGNGNAWSAEFPFRGEVKFYDAQGESHGSFGSDGRPGRLNEMEASVSINGEQFAVQGAGRHELRDPGTGQILGYAELVPETAEERVRLWKEHDEREGIEEKLSGSYGCNDGWGKAIGFFGEENKKLNWSLTGVAEVRFLNPRTGRIVYGGHALPLPSPEERASLRQSLPPGDYQQRVAETLPTLPVFEWSTGGAPAKRHVGFGSFPLDLPNGTHLTAEVVPFSGHAAH